jgi:dienelactone hydrolase
VPADQRAAFEKEMKDGGVDWQLYLYGGAAHSFTNPTASAMGMPGIEYHEPTDRRSWAAMLDLFSETLV